MGAIKYKGFGNRVIRKQDWETVGVTDQDTTVWNEDNNYTVDDKELKSGAKSYLAQQTDFEVVTDSAPKGQEANK